MVQQNKKKIILHCGAPKTGSTSLQFFFADHLSELKADGVFFPRRFLSKGDVDPLHRSLVAMRSGNKPEAALQEARCRLQDLFGKEGYDTVLISNESLLGEPFHEGNSIFFPKMRESLEMLRCLCEGYDVEVVYFIRDFNEYIPSYYVQDIRRGGTRSFRAYCAAIDSNTLSWEVIVAAIVEAFGSKKVRVFDHALLRSAPEQTADQAFGMFFPSLPTFPGGTYGRNRSVGGWVLPVYRCLNCIFSLVVPKKHQAKGRRLMRRYLFVPLAQIAPKRKQSVPADIAVLWKSRFVKDKKALGLHPNTIGNSE